MRDRSNPAGFEGSSRELPCRSLPPQYTPNVLPDRAPPAPLGSPLVTPAIITGPAPGEVASLPRAGGAAGKG
jgi:hypothetical protein